MPTLTKTEAQVTKISNQKYYNLANRTDYKQCVAAVLGDVPEEVLELWTEALMKSNKVLYEFLDMRLGNRNSDKNVVIQFTEISQKPEEEPDDPEIERLAKLNA